MSSIARSALFIGPGKITHAGHTYYQKAAAALPIELDRAALITEGHGLLDYRILDILGRLTVQPDGAWTANARAALWPYSNTRPGASLGASDPDLVLHCYNQEIYTAKCAVLTKMPDLFLGARETIIGEAEYTLIREDNKNWTEADSLLALSSGSFADSALTVASIKTQPYTGVLTAITGYTAIESEEGWSVSFDLGVTLKGSDSYGTLDIFFQSLAVTVSCVPVNITPTDLLSKFQGTAGLKRGASLQALGTHAAQFKLTGADGTDIITFPNAGLVKGGFRFGSNVYRQDAITIVATRTLAAGAPVALFTLA